MGQARNNCLAGKRMAAPSWKKVWSCATAEGVPRRSLVVALVVGTLLNAINQGDVLLAGHALNWSKIVLTYLVPYCVATYGAVSFQLRVMGR
jgi:hypothetical protein